MNGVLRRAGFNERRCIARESLSLYGYIVITGTYSSTSAKDLSEAHVHQALKRCIARHPILSVTIHNADSEQPSLLRVPSLDLRNHLYFLDSGNSSDDTLRTLLETVHNEPLPNYEDHPRWRVYVTKIATATSRTPAQFYIAFACSHALADGRSGLAFHKTFLEALQEEPGLPSKDSAIYNVPMDLAVLPPLEQAAVLPISWSFLLGPLLSEYLPTWVARMVGVKQNVSDSGGSNGMWTGTSARPSRTPDQQLSTAEETVSIPLETVSKVLKECRKHNARLTGLLGSVVSQALAKALQAQGQENTRFEAAFAIDLRRCIPEAQEQMANFTSNTTEIMTTSEDIWELAERTTAKLEAASSTLADQPVGLLRYLKTYRDWTLRNAEVPAKQSFEVSNLGVFEGAAEGSWTVQSMALSQSADGTGAPFSVNVASVKDGPLSIVLSWWPGMLGVADERAAMQNVRKNIRAQFETISTVET